MPTVVIEGRFRFVINTRENRFEPPHVHVWVDNQDTCRINLLSGAFIERPPPGTYRDIMATSWRHTGRTPKKLEKSGKPSTGSRQ